MQFLVRNRNGSDARLVCENPENEQIESFLREIDWKGLAIILKIDGKNYLEVSGNGIGELMVAYAENGANFIAKNPPDSISGLIDLLQLYALNDGKWKTAFEWYAFDPSGQKKGCLSVVFLLMGLFLLVKSFFTVLCNRILSLFTGRTRFGSVAGVGGNESEMNVAVDEARETMSEFFSALEEKAANCDRFALKLKITDENGSEHFWLKDIAKKGDTVMGIIDNEPHVVNSVRQGDEVDVDFSAVTDWGYFRDGSGRGFFTLRALLKSLSKPERKKIMEYYGWNG